ncbi:MAG: hemerythrin domain-containing protein [Enhydrobacter sp.]|nr:MAG: hemerythrin domain-containing protein [Enhydrobacter sp.]
MARSKQPEDAIALLKEDHRKVEKLFHAFESARDPNRKKQLVEQICRELVVHATIEEEIFYPACKEHVEEDLLEEGYVEHDGAKVLIAELMDGSPDDEFFDAKVSVLSEMIGHHVKEEEKRGEGLFTQARKAGLDVDALGERLKARKQELLDEIERSGIPTPQTRSFTGHNLEESRPVA